MLLNQHPEGPGIASFGAFYTIIGLEHAAFFGCFRGLDNAKPHFFPATSFFLLPKQLTYADCPALPGYYPVSTRG
jgi:hypothetical protein